MGTAERRIDRGSDRARAILVEVGHGIRLARRTHGLSQSMLGRSAGLSAAQISRIERGLVPSVPMAHLARLAALVGLELSARLHPDGEPLRDAAQVALLGRLRSHLDQRLGWHTEVPLNATGDRRAWDAVIVGRGFRIGVEAETRLLDAQATDRRVALKVRDSEVSRTLLLLADTRSNRRTVREFEQALRVNHPVDSRAVLAALAEARDPGGDGLVLL